MPRQIDRERQAYISKTNDANPNVGEGRQIHPKSPNDSKLRPSRWWRDRFWPAHRLEPRVVSRCARASLGRSGGDGHAFDLGPMRIPMPLSPAVPSWLSLSLIHISEPTRRTPISYA